MQASYRTDGDQIPHTPAADVSAGDVVVLDENLVTVARLDIAAGEPGSLWRRGHYEAVKDDSVMDPGCPVYWDPDGDPVGGTAGSGAFSALPLGPFAGWNGDTERDATATVCDLYLDSENVPHTQTVSADDSESALNTVLPGVEVVIVEGVTNGANDFIVLPSLAAHRSGKPITVIGSAGSNFEVRTPATSAEEINSEDCDGTKEYLFTDTQIHEFVKINDTIGWMGHGYSAIGAVVTAVVPD